MQKLLLFIFAIVMAYGIAGCATKDAGVKESESTGEKGISKAEASRFEFPKDYKNWTHTTSKIILDKSSPLYGFQQVFVNDIALDAYKRGNGYPEGSTILIGFYEAIVEGDSIIQGDIIWYAGMRKDTTATKTGGWIFDGFDSKTLQSKIDGPIGGCYNCHTAKKERDYVFTEFAGEVAMSEGGSFEAKPGSFAFPVDFRSWWHSNSKVILDKNSPLYGFQQIYVNESGFEVNKTGGVYPDGSVVIVGFYEPVRDGDVISQGNIIWYAAMKKDSTAAETGGWIFDGFDSVSLKSKIDDPVAGCYTCHVSKKDNDYIFSQYVP